MPPLASHQSDTTFFFCTSGRLNLCEAGDPPAACKFQSQEKLPRSFVPHNGELLELRGRCVISGGVRAHHAAEHPSASVSGRVRLGCRWGVKAGDRPPVLRPPPLLSPDSAVAQL